MILNKMVSFLAVSNTVLHISRYLRRVSQMLFNVLSFEKHRAASSDCWNGFIEMSNIRISHVTVAR